jgi:hypothetical protein
MPIGKPRKNTSVPTPPYVGCVKKIDAQKIDAKTDGNYDARLGFLNFRGDFIGSRRKNVGTHGVGGGYDIFDELIRKEAKI